MFKVLGVGEMEVDARTYGLYVVFIELLDVVGEIKAADPDLSEPVFGL